MKKSFCVLLFVLLAGCAYTAAHLEDYPTEITLAPEYEFVSEAEEFLLECAFNEIPRVLPFTEYEPIPAFVQETSPFGRQVATEFLRDYWTLFDFESRWFCLETERFFARCPETWEWKEANGAHMFYWSGVRVQRDDGTDFIDYDGRIFDTAGREITGVPFIRHHDNPWFPNVAFLYDLYDFSGSGIPDIIVTFLPVIPSFEGCLQGSVGETILYRFVDGAYREMGVLPHWSYDFFTNMYEEIIMLNNDVLCGAFGYYFLRFTGNGIAAENIFTPEEHTQEWFEHHSWEDFYQNPRPTMFYTGMPLTRIFSLTDLANEIREEFLRGLTATANEATTQKLQEFAIQALEELFCS